MSYERLTSDNAAVLFIDHQTGLANWVQTQSPPEFINNVRALVRIAQIYKLPSIITTSSHDGPNGPIMPAVAEGLPEATIVHRPGEINAWDNKDFVTAVKKIGRKKLLIAGISTEVCLAFVSLSARDAGYDVYAAHCCIGRPIAKLLQHLRMPREAAVSSSVAPATLWAFLEHMRQRGSADSHPAVSFSGVCVVQRGYRSFAYSDLASFRMGMSGSASFQRARKSW
jgi:nicotinamidase-related amidase